MIHAICLGLFLPLLGFLVLMTTSSFIGRRLAGIIACSTLFVSFVCFASLLSWYTAYDLSPQNFTLYQWVPVAKIQADFMLRLDPLSLVMTLIITGVGFLIHVYSIGYMEHDEDYARYFACMNFFVFSMLLLVLAGHLLLLFVGWEGVGLASYLLIGFDYHRPSAAEAAVKAFVMNRIGDLGFLLGLLLTFHMFGTGDISEVSRLAVEQYPLGAPLVGILTLLYFIGSIGKSAQIPLHTWLPDAMEGPTPVSALIHAATMVTAGVYLVVRLHPVFMLAPTTLQIIGVIGAVTSLFASLCAVGQYDLKKVLAYSTVSQLGLMFVACGIGAFYAAMFHLTTHAFVKALLFLSAGNVVHMMRGTTDMAKMGGLAQKFPKTRWLFLIGVLALSGIPPLSAFFSKDLILEQEYLSGFETLYGIALAASILTGFYLTRAYCIAFTGQSRLEPKIFKAVHEAPSIMIVPVLLLAILSVAGGFLGFAVGKTPLLEGFLAEVGVTLSETEPAGGMLAQPETWMAIIGSLGGVLLAAWIYMKHIDQLGHTWAMLRTAFYVDEFYDVLIVRPLKGISKVITYFIEPKVFDGLIQVLVSGTQGAAHWLQMVQSGQIRSYVAWMAVGAVLLIAYFVL